MAAQQVGKARWGAKVDSDGIDVADPSVFQPSNILSHQERRGQSNSPRFENFPRNRGWISKPGAGLPMFWMEFSDRERRDELASTWRRA